MRLEVVTVEADGREEPDWVKSGRSLEPRVIGY